jgi:hypothetical protein
VELGATELTGAELAADEAGVLLPPPPPPQAVRPTTNRGRVQVLIMDCMIIRVLRYF